MNARLRYLPLERLHVLSNCNGNVFGIGAGGSSSTSRRREAASGGVRKPRPACSGAARGRARTGRSAWRGSCGKRPWRRTRNESRQRKWEKCAAAPRAAHFYFPVWRNRERRRSARATRPAPAARSAVAPNTHRAPNTARDCDSARITVILPVHHRIQFQWFPRRK